MTGRSWPHLRTNSAALAPDVWILKVARAAAPAESLNRRRRDIPARRAAFFMVEHLSGSATRLVRGVAIDGMTSTLRLVVHLVAKRAGSFDIDNASRDEDDTVLSRGLLFGEISARDVPFDKRRFAIGGRTEAAPSWRAYANNVTGSQRDILVLGK